MFAIAPLTVWFFKYKWKFLSNLGDILSAKKSLVGYIPDAHTYKNLPEIKPGILNPSILFAEIKLDKEKKSRLNMLYAKDYRILNDMEILAKGWKNLDKTSQ